VTVVASNDRTRRWAIRLGLTIALGLPVFLCFNFVYRFAVDVPFWDQWELVPVLAKWAEGTLSFEDLFAQHNEHRLLFPRTVMVLLAAATHWDTRVEMWFNFLLVVGMGAVLFYEHLAAFGRTARSAALFIPSAWLIFTLRQESNLLCGWNIQNTMCAAGLCCAMSLLRRSDRHPGFLIGAIACAAVSCFSFASGILAWPAGLACLLWRLMALKSPTLRKVRLRNLGVWLAASGLGLGSFFRGWHKTVGHPPIDYGLLHLGKALQFFSMQVGGSLAHELDLSRAALMGAVLIALTAGVGFAAARGWLEAEKVSFAVPLIAFAALSSVLVTIGRVGLLEIEPELTAASRYTTLTLLGVVGLYQCCLALERERLRIVGAGLVATLICIGIFAALDTAYPLAIEVRRQRLQMRAALLDWRAGSDASLESLYPDATEVRARAAVLERLRLSVFRDPAPTGP
jgi:hypothetical protein